ncbi:MAG: diacylglycerol kinase family protein [bacterium]
MIVKFRNFFRSFTHAWRGIISGSQGKNIRIQFFFGLLILLAGVIFQISFIEWLIVLTLIALVLGAELINTAVEEVCNIIKDFPGIHPKATKEARDIAAGSVLVICIGAGIVGLFIFMPKLLEIIFGLIS